MPPEAPTTDVAPETSKHTLEELGQLLRRLHPNATMVPRPGLPQALQVKREAGGAFKIEVNPDHFSDETFSTVLAQALTQIEQLEFEGNLAGKSEAEVKAAFSLYKKRTEKPAHRLFYQTLFQIMALHRGAVHLPILRHHLSAIGKRAMSALHLRKDNFPLHIQLLFGLMGMTEGLNPEVINSLDELRAGGFWGRLTHLHTPEEDRLRMLNDDFFPLYEYFLNRDLKEWRKKKPKTEPEESSEPSETVDPPEDEAEQDEAEQNTPDYNPRYDTPDGQKMEEAPEGSGYKLEVFPPLTGWYAVDRKNRFIEQGLIWESTAVHSPYTTNTEFTGKKYTIGGRLVGSGTKPIPLPNGYALEKDSLQIVNGNSPVILRDSNGNFFFRIQGRCEFSIDFYKEKKPVQAQVTPEDSQKIYQGALSPKAESAIQQAQQVASTRQSAEMIRDYVRKNHFYPPGGNSADRFNQALQHQKQLKKGCTSGTEYIRALDAASHLDCYSASTLMVAMLRNLNIPCRIVTGHRVDGLDEDGNAVINLANGHAWVEAYLGSEWVRLDPVPPVDPNEPKDEKDETPPKEGDKDKPTPEQADDHGIDTPPEESEEGEEGEEDGEGEGESDDEDGGEDSDDDDESNEGNEGNGDGGGQDNSGGGSGGGSIEPPDADDYEDDPDFDPEAEFERLYEELKNHVSEAPPTEEVEDAMEQIRQEAGEITLDEELPDPVREAIEKQLEGLSPEELAEWEEFVRHFLTECEKMKQIPNPNAHPSLPNPDYDHPMLVDALRAILNRVISRSVKEEEIPRYPVADGPILFDPVGLGMANRAGIRDPMVWQNVDIEEVEELKIVKVRRIKILDGSGSMMGMTLQMQQLIEVLENLVTAEKQAELDQLSHELDRDVRLETESWQFGVWDPKTGRPFRCLKKLSPEFNVLEQAVTWQLAGRAAGSTNDYDPLEAIYNELIEEYRRESAENPDAPTTLERIRAGFYIRELKNWEEFEQNGGEEQLKKDWAAAKKAHQEAEKLYRHSRKDEDKTKLYFAQCAFDEVKNSYTYFKNLQNKHEALAAALEQLEEKYSRDELEPIIEVIEVTTDGGSDSPSRVQKVIKKLRGLGVVVIGYGLGAFGTSAVSTYRNPDNPSEGGVHCANLLDYPLQKERAWHRILDKV